MIQVKRLFVREEFIGDCALANSTINCAIVKGADTKVGYLTASKVYDGYDVVFKQPTEGAYIKGVWINEGGSYVLIDAELNDFIEACNACCGENAVVAPQAAYAGGYPNLFPDAVLADFQVQIKDGGTDRDYEKFKYKYTPIGRDFGFVSRNNSTGVTTYKFRSFAKNVPPQLGPDMVTMDIVTETARTYDSNTPAALTTGQHYNVLVKVDGNAVGVPSPFAGAANATLTDVATAMNANTTYAAYGTYSVVGGKLRLSSIEANQATIAVSAA